MQLPPVHSFSETEYFVSGNVIIHETAAIAPGVMLDAGADGQIIIGAGVCIGIGSVIIASAGTVEIETGVALAPGTLVIGPTRIGHAACVGSQSTIFQRDIEAHGLIPAGDLLLVAPTPTEAVAPPLTSPSPPVPPKKTEISPIPSPWDSGESLASPPSDQGVRAESPPDDQTKQTVEEPGPGVVLSPDVEQEPEVVPTQPEITQTANSPEPKAPVVGQVYINQLLLTLFPERKFFQS